MTETSIASRLKHPKEVGNFATNDFNNEWCIFYSNDGNKVFPDKVKKLYEYLKSKKKLAGTFTEWLYSYWKIRNHNVKDVRIVFIGGHLATSPHTDIGHLYSSNNSVTLHLNT